MAGTSGQITLFLKGVEPEVTRSSIELSAWGSSASGVHGALTLYALADGSGVAASPLNLFARGPDSAVYTSYLNLFAEGGTTRVDAAVPLYAHGPSGVQQGVTLFVRGSGVTAGAIPYGSALPLFIRRPASDAIPLYLQGPGTPSSGLVTLYTHGAHVTSSGVSLYASGVGPLSSSFTLFSRGW